MNRQRGFADLITLLIYAAIAASVVALYLTWAGHQRDIGRKEVRAAWDASIQRQQAEAIAEGQRNAKETARRLERQQEAQAAHDKQIATARRDAAGAAVAAGRLRDQLAAFTSAARGTPGHPAASGNGKTAGDPIGVLADLFSRADERAGVLAAEADRTRAAGVQCERSYEALSK